MGDRVDPSRFTDLERIMIQALMSRRAVEESIAIELHQRAFIAVNGEVVRDQ
jgi:hypothetical protein